MSIFVRPDGIPALEDTAVRDGVRLAYAVHGAGPVTLLLMPTWSIATSQVWKMQVPYLSRYFRVVTFDGRGSGKSDRPTGPSAYADREYALDALAVLDATGTDRAVVVGLSCGTMWAAHLAAECPERVEGLVAVAPSCPFDAFDVAKRAADHHREFWVEEGGYDQYLSAFYRRLFSEPHSTKQIEDGIAWGHQIAPETLADSKEGRLGLGGAACHPIEPLCPRITCPVLVMHGTDDQIATIDYGERLAELTGGQLLRFEGSGHGIAAREPARFNAELRRFIEQIHPIAKAAREWVPARSRPKRVLYLSSPIGLGHARRDAAIAAELRRLHPELRIDWLTQHPVTRLLDDLGEFVHPASRWLISESAHVEHQSGEHDLHAFQALREMDAILMNNFGVFADVVEEQHYDLVVGDEAWDVDYFLHENPEMKRAPFAWMTDFVGWLPMPEGGVAEAALTTDYNTEMLEQRDRFRTVRDRSIFVGNECDIVNEKFGPGLPRIREWTAANFHFSGYITGFEPTSPEQRNEVRQQLGYRDDEQVCIVTVGGSGVGLSLLRRVLDAAPMLRRAAPQMRVVLVTGPRIDPAALPSVEGVDVHDYLPNLVDHLAACDVAVVQGGLSTCMELTANKRPFVYVPLRRHFEQNFHVRHRLEGYRAGTCLPYVEASDPDRLTSAILTEAQRIVDYKPVESDGAARAAALIGSLL